MSTRYQCWIIAAIFAVAALGLIGSIANDLWSGSAPRSAERVVPVGATSIKR